MKMKHVVTGLAALLGMAAAQAGTQVGVSVAVSQPGFYGRIDIGNSAPPPVVYAQPVIIHPPAVVVPRSPIYLRVRPGHEKNWAKYCHRYNACAQPVYFVRSDAVVGHGGRPHESRGGHREHHRHEGKHSGKGEGKGHGRKHD